MKSLILIVVTLIFYVNPVDAYVGPGLGAGTIAAIAGVLLSILMAILGVFWYPIKRLFKKSDEEETLEGEASTTSVEADIAQNKDQQK